MLGLNVTILCTHELLHDIQHFQQNIFSPSSLFLLITMDDNDPRVPLLQYTLLPSVVEVTKTVI